MTHLDDPHELDVIEPHLDIDQAMLRLDVALAADADRHLLTMWQLWGRADLLIDPDGTVRYA